MITSHTQHLPPVILDLIDVIGAPATEIIVRERGGVSLCVPGKTTPEHWLHDAIGKTAFEQLVKTYRGVELWIPRCTRALQAMRDQQILQAAESGTSIVQIALQYGYTDRGIHKILQRLRAPDNQIDMFNNEDQ